MTGAEPINERVVVDGKVVTSKEPGTAVEFVIKLVELLFGRRKRVNLKMNL